MAASGVINGTTSNQYIAVKIEWKLLWQNTATNVSAVEAILYARRTNTGYVTSGTGSFTVSINGAANTTSKYVEIGTSWVQIGSNAQQIAHEADGTKQINISASGSIPVAGLTSISVGGTVGLDTIPRASQPSLSAGDFDLGSTITINLNPASSSFTHAVRFSLGAYATTIGEGIKSSMTYQFPLDLASQMPNATSLQGRLWVDTYSGGTYIGTKEVYYTARVPASVVPTAGGLTVSDAAGHTAKTGGLYVQGQSRASVAVGQSAGAYGSTIKSTVIKVGSVSRAATASTFDLPSAGTVSISATVTDSRGRTHTRTSTITVAAYTPPVITGFSAARVTAAGAADDLGSYIRAISSGTATTLTNNTLSWAVAWLNGSTWTTLRSGTDTAAPLAWSDNAVVGAGGFSPTSSYRLRVTATDLITTTTREITLPTGSVTMSWGKTGVGIGKVIERGTLDVGGDAYATNVRADGLLYEGGQNLDKLYGSGVSRYDHKYGYLIQTNLPAAGIHMWELDVRFNTYSRATLDGTGWLWLQGCSYDINNTMRETAGRSTIGPRQARAFNYGGFLCFWIAPSARYETAHFYLRGTEGSNNAAIINLTDSGLPTDRTREAVIDVQTLGYETPWTELPTTGASGFTRYEPVQYKRIDKQVLIRGGIHRESYGDWTGNTTYTVGTLPVGFRPTQQTALTVYSDPATTSTPPVMAIVLPDGRINVKASGTANYWPILGGSFYS